MPRQSSLFPRLKLNPDELITPLLLPIIHLSFVNNTSSVSHWCRDTHISPHTRTHTRANTNGVNSGKMATAVSSRDSENPHDQTTTYIPLPTSNRRWCRVRASSRLKSPWETVRKLIQPKPRETSLIERRHSHVGRPRPSPFTSVRATGDHAAAQRLNVSFVRIDQAPSRCSQLPSRP